MNLIQPLAEVPLGTRSLGTAAALPAHSPETPAHQKLRKAAEAFESMLISELWQGFQSGTSSLTGESPPAGSDTLGSLATQSMAAGLAHRGGLGIARMIFRQLEPSLSRGGEGSTRGEIKSASLG